MRKNVQMTVSSVLLLLYFENILEMYYKWVHFDVEDAAFIMKSCF